MSITIQDACLDLGGARRVRSQVDNVVIRYQVQVLDKGHEKKYEDAIEGDKQRAYTLVVLRFYFHDQEPSRVFSLTLSYLRRKGDGELQCN